MQVRAIGPVEKNRQNKVKNRKIVNCDFQRQYAPGTCIAFSYGFFVLNMAFSWDSSFVAGWSKLPILPGLEPGIPWFVVRCLIHWATGPKKFEKNKKVILTKKPNVCKIFTKIVIYAIRVRCKVARSAPYKKRSRKGQKSQYRLSRSTSLICAGNRYRVFAWFFFVG